MTTEWEEAAQQLTPRGARGLSPQTMAALNATRADLGLDAVAAEAQELEQAEDPRVIAARFQAEAEAGIAALAASYGLSPAQARLQEAEAHRRYAEQDATAEEWQDWDNAEHDAVSQELEAEQQAELDAEARGEDFSATVTDDGDTATPAWLSGAEPDDAAWTPQPDLDTYPYNLSADEFNQARQDAAARAAGEAEAVRLFGAQDAGPVMTAAEVSADMTRRVAAAEREAEAVRRFEAQDAARREAGVEYFNRRDQELDAEAAERELAADQARSRLSVQRAFAERAAAEAAEAAKEPMQDAWDDPGVRAAVRATTAETARNAAEELDVDEDEDWMDEPAAEDLRRPVAEVLDDAYLSRVAREARAEEVQEDGPKAATVRTDELAAVDVDEDDDALEL